MKNSIKSINIITMIILSIFIFFPLKSYAQNYDNPYYDVNTINNIEITNMNITNVTFVDYSLMSTQAFGLSGVINNESEQNITYETYVYFYDLNKNLIAQGSKNNIAVPGINNFDQMFNTTILNGYNVSEVKYYRIEISIKELEVYEEDITPSKNLLYESEEYVIDKYDINVVVNENNTFDITETITAYFNLQKHGIIRKIPLRNEVKRNDGTTSNNRVQITNVYVNHEFKKTQDSKNLNIKIGSQYTYLTGEQQYVIKYNYNIGKDPVTKYDELYFNLIGTQWDTVIGNITFTITMPKEFDSSKLGFSTGNYGSTDNGKIKYTVNGNTITGSYTGILGKNEGITVRTELPEGYFVGAGHKIEIEDYIFGFLPIIFLGISYLLWAKYGKDEPVVEVVEFYPPKGFNSLEIAHMYKGHAQNKDVVSLLIYLANKGYIKISEGDKKTIFSKESFKIIKLKDYDGNVECEKIFLEDLFDNKPLQSLFSTNKDKKEPLTEVTEKDLENSFYRTLTKILSLTNTRKNKHIIFEKNSTNKRIIIILFIIATFCAITLPPLIKYDMIETAIFTLFFPATGLTFAFIMIVSKDDRITVNGEEKNSRIGVILFGIIFGLAFSGFPLFGMMYPIFSNDIIYLIIYIIGVLCVFGMVVCQQYVYKRTPYGNEMLGRIQGFKNFLEVAEKDRLESLVMQNPTYFYDILPYTYVLGVSDKWIKKFETIAMSAPDWYENINGDSFNMKQFGNFIEDTMSSATRVMASSPSSDGGSGGFSGGSSGGGSSGGGSGGGGGSSW